MENHGLTIGRLGHASLRLDKRGGTVIYIDPWLDVIGSEPQDGDVVFVTHDDYDHDDLDGIAAVAKPDTVVAVYQAVDASDLDITVIDHSHQG